MTDQRPTPAHATPAHPTPAHPTLTGEPEPTTLVDPRVTAALLPHLTTFFGNPEHPPVRRRASPALA
jgi:hypothetical protein